MRRVAARTRSSSAALAVRAGAGPGVVGSTRTASSTMSRIDGGQPLDLGPGGRLVRGGHLARDREPLAHAGADGVGVRGDPGAVRPPRLGGLHDAERLEPLVERPDLDLLDGPARPGLERLAGRGLDQLQDLDGHQPARRERRGVVLEAPGDDRVERRTVARQPPDRVERRRQRHHALPRHQPVRRAQPPQALVARRARGPTRRCRWPAPRPPGRSRPRSPDRSTSRPGAPRGRRRWPGCRSAGWRPRSSTRARPCGPGRAPTRRP